MGSFDPILEEGVVVGMVESTIQTREVAKMAPRARSTTVGCHAKRSTLRLWGDPQKLQMENLSMLTLQKCWEEEIHRSDFENFVI